MKTELFRGVGTALVTPFRGGKIDYKELEWLIERQVVGGTEAIVIGGTTGEAATLGDDERYDLFRASKSMVGGRCRLIFGTGTNDTARAVKHTKAAEEIGCDGVLLVTPYYNKGTREGVYKHYELLAKCTNLPIMIYNVPSRTGVNLAINTIERLSKFDNIVAIKEAGGGADRLTEVSRISDIALYAGNDGDVLTALRLGGRGVVSVVSNLYPDDMHSLTDAYFKGDTKRADAILSNLSPLINALFLDTNPAPLKYALSLLGLCTGEMRLPMYEIDGGVKEAVRSALFEYEALRSGREGA